MASTPPPPSPSTLQVPRAPRLGPKYDNYEPYPTRQSARLATQRIVRASRHTPPPNAPAKTGTTKRTLSPSSPGNSSHAPSLSRISPFVAKPAHPPISARQSRSSAERALPTPVKTPSKKQIPDSSSGSVNRSLFPPSSTSKRRKMDSSKKPDEPRSHQSARQAFQVYSDPSVSEIIDAVPSTPAAPAPISIHTDSRDRIPVTNSTDGNVFNTGPETPAQISIHTDSRDRIAVNNNTDGNVFTTGPENPGPVRRVTRSTTTTNEGIWYNFRGQRAVFRRFAEIEEDEEDEDDLGLFKNRPDLLARNPDCLKGIQPLRQSEIKPRVLFPRPRPRGPTNLPAASAIDPFISDTNEEDATDVEDHDSASPSPGRAGDSHDKQEKAPKQPQSGRTTSPAGSLYDGHTMHPDDITPPSASGSLYDGRTMHPDDLTDSSGTDRSLSNGHTMHSEDQNSRRPSTSAGVMLDWLKTSSHRRSRPRETAAERVKRHREARGSPLPRTRRALRAAGAAALTAGSETPTPTPDV